MAFLSHLWVPLIEPGIIPRRIQSLNVEMLSQPAYAAASFFDNPRGASLLMLHLSKQRPEQGSNAGGQGSRVRRALVPKRQAMFGCLRNTSIAFANRHW
jgi:hypothetical protein